MKDSRRKAVTLVELLVVAMLAVLVLGGPIVGALCWPYAINQWLVYAEKSPDMLWWHGALMGILPPLGYLSIVAALFTWVVMMFLV